MLSKYPFQNAYADGLSFESLPPSLVAGRPISLFIKIDPQILNPESAGNASLQLRLFDSSNNETIKHVTYGVHVIKDYEDLMILSFHSHSGPLKLNILPTEGPITVLNGEWEQTHGSWVSKTGSVDGILDVQAPIMLQGGLYHFQITILGMTDDSNVFDPSVAPTFDSWLSVGEAFHGNFSYNNENHDLTIISYYDKIQEIRYEPQSYAIHWSMPFDWNLDRIGNQNIFVHEEVRFPKSFISFLNSTSFRATVNNIPLSSFAIAVDPYSSETEYTVHYIINKDAIMKLGQIHRQQQSNSTTANDDNLMSFSLKINAGRKDQTSNDLVTTSGIKVHTSWEPGQLTSNSESRLNIEFSDAQNVTVGGSPINDNVEYGLTIINKNGTKVIERDRLVAINGTDVQAITFPANETYEIIVNITGLSGQGKEIDQSRNGIATGIIVVPEFQSGAAIILVSTSLASIIFLRRSWVWMRARRDQ